MCLSNIFLLKQFYELVWPRVQVHKAALALKVANHKQIMLTRIRLPAKLPCTFVTGSLLIYAKQKIILSSSMQFGLGCYKKSSSLPFSFTPLQSHSFHPLLQPTWLLLDKLLAEFIEWRQRHWCPYFHPARCGLNDGQVRYMTSINDDGVFLMFILHFHTWIKNINTRLKTSLFTIKYTEKRKEQFPC